MDESIETISFPKPSKILTDKPSLKKYIKYLGFFGPGAIVASNWCIGRVSAPLVDYYQHWLIFYCIHKL
jgi:hypothetical protein